MTTAERQLYAENNLFYDLPRRFTGVPLPACLWWGPKGALSLEAKIILAEIDQLCTRPRPGSDLLWCWASNEHFGRLIEKEERTVQRALRQLEDYGLLVMQFETAPPLSGKPQRFIALNGRDLSDAIQKALERNAFAVPPTPDRPESNRPSELTGGPDGILHKQAPVNSDAANASKRVTNLTPLADHSLDSEKDSVQDPGTRVQAAAASLCTMRDAGNEATAAAGFFKVQGNRAALLAALPAGSLSERPAAAAACSRKERGRDGIGADEERTLEENALCDFLMRGGLDEMQAREIVPVRTLEDARQWRTKIQSKTSGFTRHKADDDWAVSYYGLFKKGQLPPPGQIGEGPRSTPAKRWLPLLEAVRQARAGQLETASTDPRDHDAQYLLYWLEESYSTIRSGDLTGLRAAANFLRRNGIEPFLRDAKGNPVTR